MKQLNSFFDRKRNTSYVSEKPVHINDRRLQVSSSLNTKTNRMVKKTEFKTIDKSAIKKFKVSDFALENLLSVNADLKPCTLQGSRFENIRRIESSLDNLQTMSNENKTE